jgi:hypothetical protein
MYLAMMAYSSTPSLRDFFFPFIISRIPTTPFTTPHKHCSYCMPVVVPSCRAGDFKVGVPPNADSLSLFATRIISFDPSLPRTPHPQCLPLLPRLSYPILTPAFDQEGNPGLISYIVLDQSVRGQLGGFWL